jgi:leucyl-tRNA synthetase
MPKNNPKKQEAGEYNPQEIEPKWQKIWDTTKIYQAEDGSKKPKFYSLIEFPFPSGEGMHTGHWRSNTAMDIISRKRRMQGYNVLYPIGWDAFGLPTENYAIKTGVHPKIVTEKNTDNFRKQLKAAGFSFDWSREINTSDPDYYRWTQWIFLQFYKHGLAYKKKMVINWCPKDKIGLANEEVIDGRCERCGTLVEKKEKEQWMLAITKYADRLDKDLDTVDYQEKIKIQQRNWIGKSEGAEIEFALKDSAEKIKVFTTRPDTLFGATYMVFAPEHELIQKLKKDISNSKEVDEYIREARNKSEIERTTDKKDKSGVELKGIKAINPANNEEIPVYIADYVLAHYGTGAIMAVPAHDERDFEFAKKHKLPIREVIEPLFIKKDDKDGVRSELPFKKRHAVVAVVKHWSEDKYLCLKWKKRIGAVL